MTAPRYKFSLVAARELSDIKDYVAANSGQLRAIMIVLRILRACDRVAEMPGIGRPTPKPAVRELIVRPWCIFYAPRAEGHVEILRIVDGRRNLVAMGLRRRPRRKKR